MRRTRIWILALLLPALLLSGAWKPRPLRESAAAWVRQDGAQMHTVGMARVEMSADGDEALFGGMSTEKADLPQMRAAAVPNTLTEAGRIPAGDAKRLEVYSNRCGIVLTPSQSGDITLDLMGGSAPERIAVSARAKSGEVAVNAQASSDEAIYVSTVKNRLVNVLRVGVPADIAEIVIEDGASCIRMEGLDVALRAKLTSGVLRVQGDALTRDMNLEATSGDLIVQGDTVTGAVSLAVTSGDAVLEASRVDGGASLTATSGDVWLSAELVRSARLAVTSGDAHAKVGRIERQLLAEATSGDVSVRLTRAPENLTFRQRSTGSSTVILPSGWINGRVVGSGKPVLEMSANSGDLSLTVEGY